MLTSLGIPNITCSKITFIQESMKQIITAMRNTGLKRIIIVGSQYTKRKKKLKHCF